MRNGAKRQLRLLWLRSRWARFETKATPLVVRVAPASVESAAGGTESFTDCRSRGWLRRFDPSELQCRSFPSFLLRSPTEAWRASSGTQPTAAATSAPPLPASTASGPPAGIRSLGPLAQTDQTPGTQHMPFSAYHSWEPHPPPELHICSRANIPRWFCLRRRDNTISHMQHQPRKSRTQIKRFRQTLAFSSANLRPFRTSGPTSIGTPTSENSIFHPVMGYVIVQLRLARCCRSMHREPAVMRHPKFLSAGFGEFGTFEIVVGRPCVQRIEGCLRVVARCLLKSLALRDCVWCQHELCLNALGVKSQPSPSSKVCSGRLAYDASERILAATSLEFEDGPEAFACKGYRNSCYTWGFLDSLLHLAPSSGFLVASASGACLASHGASLLRRVSVATF